MANGESADRGAGAHSRPGVRGRDRGKSRNLYPRSRAAGPVAARRQGSDADRTAVQGRDRSASEPLTGSRARESPRKAQGLSFRESCRPRVNALSLSDLLPHKFWMKNTMIPLDMIWMDGAGRVVFVSANTPPCKADPCPSYGPDVPAVTVLEIAGGQAAKEKVTVGSRIRFEEVPK